MIHVLIFFNELKHKEGFIVNEVATNTKNICGGSSLLLKKKRSFCGKLFLPQIKKKKNLAADSLPQNGDLIFFLLIHFTWTKICCGWDPLQICDKICAINQNRIQKRSLQQKDCCQSTQKRKKYVCSGKKIRC